MNDGEVPLWLKPVPKRLNVTITPAVQHVRKMRGGSQAHLMRCMDGNFYVVKFRNNPQHLRVLANEMLATHLAQSIGLPVPAMAVVEVGDWLVQHTPELTIQLPGSVVPCQAGLHFGSRYAVSPLQGQVFDYLPASMLGRVRNLDAFAGVLALDKWLGNTDARQAVFWRRMRERKYTATFIDQGYCFNASEWTFPDQALRGVYSSNEVYAGVTGWTSFEPWLARIEGMNPEVIWEGAEAIPPAWYGSDWTGLENLVRQVIERRKGVRDLISAFRASAKTPFPGWGRERNQEIGVFQC
jgi:HipA-like kinase